MSCIVSEVTLLYVLGHIKKVRQPRHTVQAETQWAHRREFEMNPKREDYGICEYWLAHSRSTSDKESSWVVGTNDKESSWVVGTNDKESSWYKATASQALTREWVTTMKERLHDVSRSVQSLGTGWRMDGG
jgi:hypothetical protein